MSLNTGVFLLSVMKELEALQQVWEITRDWEENWNQWKTGCFLTLQTEAMETMAHGLFRRLTRLAKEFKVCGERRARQKRSRWRKGNCVGKIISYSDASHFCSGPKLGNY